MIEKSKTHPTVGRILHAYGFVKDAPNTPLPATVVQTWGSDMANVQVQGMWANHGFGHAEGYSLHTYDALTPEQREEVRKTDSRHLEWPPRQS